MFILQEKENGKFRNVAGKFQYGAIPHAERRAEKIYGGKLNWKHENSFWNGYDYKGKHWYKIKQVMSNPINKLLARKDLQPATRHFAQATEASRKHSRLTANALEKYGDHGAQISGVIRDHFPKDVKDKLRKLAREVTKHSDEAYAARPKGVRLTTMRALSRAVAKQTGSGFYGPQANPKRKKTMRKKNPERITDAWLTKRVGLLNDMLKRPKTQYTEKTGGGLTGNRGHLFIDHAYGGVKVAMMAGNGTGEHNISDGYVPKRELNNFINGMIAGVREAQSGRKQNPAKRSTPGFSAGFKLAKGQKTMRKKKRSAKQLANDRRLGRMAKARAKKKRGGRRKKNVARRPKRIATTKQRAASMRRAKRPLKSAKSHLWLIFACKGNRIKFQSVITWTTKKANAIYFKLKSEASKEAHYRAKQNLPSVRGWQIGVAPDSMSAASIKAKCQGKA